MDHESTKWRCWARWVRYSQTKLANAAFTAALHHKLVAKNSKVKALVAHPGLKFDGLPLLESLSIESGNDLKDLSQIAFLPSLQKLSLSYTKNIQDLKPLAVLPKLQRLVLRSTGLRQAQIDVLSGISGLKIVR